jgi:hypothetical protein
MSVGGNMFRTIRGRAAQPREATSPTMRSAPPQRERSTSNPSSAVTRRQSLTQRFFMRGEEQEATQYKGVILDADDAVEPKPEFDSFDEIPHRRRPLLILAGVILTAVVGVATWRSFHFLSRPGSSVAAASKAMVAAPPEVAAPAPSPVTTPPQAARPAVEPEVVPIAPAPTPSEAVAAPAVAAKAAEPAAERPAAPAARTSEPAARPAAAAIGDDSKADDAEPGSAGTRTRAKAPLHGYVWSPASNALVPAGTAVMDSASRGEPPASAAAAASGSADDESAAAPAPSSSPSSSLPSTSPSAFEGRTPAPKTGSGSGSAPIIE